MSRLTVGVLFSQRGFSRWYGCSQLRGTILAIEEINLNGGLDGRMIDPIICDPGSEPKQYSKLANKLLLDEGVSVIFGCTTSFSRKAVTPCVEKRNAILFYPTCYEGFDFSPNIIFTGPCPNQLHLELHQYLYEKGRASYYLLGSDYVFPKESNRVIKDLVAQSNGKVVREKYVPLACAESQIDDIVADIMSTKANVVLSTVVGSGSARLYDAFNERGITSDNIIIASLTASELDLSKMKHLPLSGHVTSSPYFASIETSENRLFCRRFVERFGRLVPIDTCAEAAYFQVHLFANAMRSLDGMDANRLREEIYRVDVNAPQGRVKVDCENNHTYQWPRIGVMDDAGTFQIVRSPLSSVKPDPYRINYVDVLAAS